METTINCPWNRRLRAIPTNAAVKEALEALGAEPGQARYIVPLTEVKSRRDYFERTYLERLKGLASSTGIPASKLTLHNFRRFFVSQCADCGIPIATVMDWVGHDEMKMVLHYYRLRDETAQRAMQKFRIRRETGRPRADQSKTASVAGVRPSRPGHGAVAPAEHPAKTAPTPAAAATPSRAPAAHSPRKPRTARRRSTSYALEHLGGKQKKTAFPAQKRGKTERGGFEPPVRV